MNQYKCRIHGFIKNKDVHHWHYTDENEKCDCEPVEAKAEAREPGLREAVQYALDVFAQYDGKHIMQALQFTDHIKKMAAALAARPVEGEK